MAQATGSFSTYDAVGNREDLSDMIFDVSPSETPILSAIKKKKATATNHEWQTDALESASATNAHIEGSDAAPGSTAATSRLGNYTQILKKHAVIPGTQEAIKSAGRKSEMAYQVARRLKAIKLDMESSMFGGAAVGNAKVAGNDTTAREMGSIFSYLTSNVSLGASGAVSAGTGADVMTAGTDRGFTEALLTTVLQSCYTNGGNPKLLAVSPTNKGVVSGFTGGGTRFVDTDEKKLVNSIDVYVGDFHTLKVVPCRQLVGDNVLALDPEYLAIAELRSVSAKDLAVTGDSVRKEITWEATLEVCNEAASGLVADTNG